MMSSSIDELVRRYIAAWSEPDTAARQQLLEAAWDTDGCYVDPQTQAASRAELDAIIADFLRQNPGAYFRPNGKISQHHGHVRFYWQLHLGDGTVLEGMDYGEVTEAGKLKKIVGFF